MRCATGVLITFALFAGCGLLLFALLLFDFGFRWVRFGGWFLSLFGEVVCCLVRGTVNSVV